jgi:hypothetical protein
MINISMLKSLFGAGYVEGWDSDGFTKSRGEKDFKQLYNLVVDEAHTTNEEFLKSCERKFILNNPDRINESRPFKMNKKKAMTIAESAAKFVSSRGEDSSNIFNHYY